MASVDAQTEMIATSVDAYSQTTFVERAEAEAQTDGTVQDNGHLLTKARRHIAHLLQAGLEAKKDLMRGSCQLQLAKQKSDNLLSKICRLKAKLMAAKTEVRDLNASRDHFEMELFAVDLRLAEANDTISQLTGDLASAYDSNDELEELLDARVLEIGMLQENHATEVESLQKAVHDKSLELAALNAILNDVALEKEQALTELSDQVLQKVAELERLSARLSDVEWDRDQCREKWRAEVEHLERELQRMQDELMPRLVSFKDIGYHCPVP
ncbi:hypothetical protein AAVH_09308 [Aphelenchoides avenae]|nr:hypothetical protein AAVH_09308 [Aphelenchus avenae]